MHVATIGICRKVNCGKSVPPGLSAQQLCVDHFLDEAFERARAVLQDWRGGSRLSNTELEWLLSDALGVVRSLEAGADTPDQAQRERMVELLLLLANLHETFAQQYIQRDRLA